jgi:hypothetical protein
MDINVKINLKSFALGASCSLGLLGMYALAVSIPNSFTAGDVVSAAKMNANFAAVKASIDTLEAAKVVGFRVRHPVGPRCVDLDNVATNNRPNAVISVTDTRLAYEIAINRPEIELSYEATIKKWQVCLTGGLGIPNVEYHVMVFNP